MDGRRHCIQVICAVRCREFGLLEFCFLASSLRRARTGVHGDRIWKEFGSLLTAAVGVMAVVHWHTGQAWCCTKVGLSRPVDMDGQSVEGAHSRSAGRC